MTRSMLALSLLVLSSCEAPKPASEWPKLVCGREQFITRDVTGTNPFTENVGLDMGSVCWRFHIDETVAGEGGPVTIDRIIRNGSGDAVGGCLMTGTSNPVRAELTAGTCEFPTNTGVARFTLEQPTGFNPRLVNAEMKGTFEINGRWREARGQDFVIGDAALTVIVDGTRASSPEVLKQAKPDIDRYATCGAPRCFTADFKGKGTLVSGGELPCRSFVDSFGTPPFSVRVDERGHVAFAEKSASVAEADWLPGLPKTDTCGTRSWTGQRGGQNQRYDLTWNADGTGTMRMELATLWTDQTVTSLCQTTWETSLTPCP
jgi:hypothetical protein